jgi:hypothetical protein
MRKIAPFLFIAFIAGMAFFSCEKGQKEVIVHDTVFVEFDEFTYLSAGQDSMGDMVIFFDPNYPDEDGPRYEMFWFEWEYNNEIKDQDNEKLDEYEFLAMSTGTSMGLKINNEAIGQSQPWTDEYGYEWQVIQLVYNTSKKSMVDFNRLVNAARKEFPERWKEK